MISNIEFKNFGVIGELKWNNLANINLLIGANGCGKTTAMKALYVTLKTLENYKKGDENRTIAELLSNKLYWTFQVNKLGDLVKKNSSGPLRLNMTVNDKKINFEFGADTTMKINKIHSDFDASKPDNSVYIPAKEVLSIFPVIQKSREQDKMFGFDDTYLDLVRALLIPSQKGSNYKAFVQSKNRLKDLLKGNITFDHRSNRWYFKQQNTKYSINVTSDGINKLGIFEQLLSNRYITPNSVIFIDEPEASLHPKAISEFMDIIAILAEKGIQIFISTHSYFVIKKLAIVAQREKINIPVMMADSNENFFVMI